jgi:hypothetical protein
LVSNGHSWLSIKNYTLSEIGVFYKAIVLSDRETKIDRLYNNWVSTHCDQNTITDLIKKMNKKSNFIDKSKEKPENVNKEWTRLAGFMKKRK